MAFLKHMDSQSASALVVLAREFDWDQMDADVRLVILHEINTAIVKLRERAGLEPIDDPLPGPHANAFLRIKEHLFPRKAEKHAGDSPAKQRHSKIGEILMSGEVVKKTCTIVDGLTSSKMVSKATRSVQVALFSVPSSASPMRLNGRTRTAVKSCRPIASWWQSNISASCRNGRMARPSRMKSACSSRARDGLTSSGLTTQCRGKSGLMARTVSRAGPGRRSTLSACSIRGLWIGSLTQRAQSAAVSLFAIFVSVSG